MVYVIIKPQSTYRDLMMFKLQDCIAQNKDHPSTFHIPDAEDITRLKVGDLAKIVFLYDEKVHTPHGVPVSSERMWIKITEINNGEFKGELDNEPNNKKLSLGMDIKFETKHICNVYFN